MVLQTVMTGLFTAVVFWGRPLIEIGRHSRRGWKGAALWILVAVAGWAMIWHSGATLYMELILGWSAPVLGGLWWLGKRHAASRALLLTTVMAPSDLPVDRRRGSANVRHMGDLNYLQGGSAHGTAAG